MPTQAEQSYQEDLMRQAIANAQINAQRAAQADAAKAAMYGADRAAQASMYGADTGLKGIQEQTGALRDIQGTYGDRLAGDIRLKGDFAQNAAQKMQELAAQGKNLTDVANITTAAQRAEQDRLNRESIEKRGDYTSDPDYIIKRGLGKRINAAFNEDEMPEVAAPSNTPPPYLAANPGESGATPIAAQPLSRNPIMDKMVMDYVSGFTRKQFGESPEVVAQRNNQQKVIDAAFQGISSTDPQVRAGSRKILVANKIDIPEEALAPADPLTIGQRDPIIQRSMNQLSELASRYGKGNYASGGSRYIPNEELPGGVPSDEELDAATKNLYLQLSERMKPEQAASLIQSLLASSLMTKPQGGFSLQMFGDRQQQAKDALARLLKMIGPQIPAR